MIEDLKNRKFILNDWSFLKGLIKRVVVYILLATSLFWISFFGNNSNLFIKIILDFLSYIGWYLYLALTPFFFTIDSLGLMLSWIQAIVFICLIHVFVHVNKFPLWVFWSVISFFFFGVFIFNVFILKLGMM
jgi:hypothetical protein